MLERQEAETIEFDAVRFVPLQMTDFDLIGEKLLQQQKEGRFAPWEIELTGTYLVVRAPNSNLPNNLMLPGGKINHDGTSEREILQQLSRAMHLYGTSSADTGTLYQRSFSYPRGEDHYRANETYLQVEILDPLFSPMAIAADVRGHRFLRLTPSQLSAVLVQEKVCLGNGSIFPLCPNLREHHRERIKYGDLTIEITDEQAGILEIDSNKTRLSKKLQAENEEVKRAKRTIEQAAKKYEAQIRQAVALEMLQRIRDEEINKQVIASFTYSDQLHFNSVLEWIIKKRVMLTSWNLDDPEQEQAFNQQYRQFLEEYLAAIQPNISNQDAEDILTRWNSQEQRAKLLTARFAEAVYEVQRKKAQQYTSRTRVQGSLMQCARLDTCDMATQIAGSLQEKEEKEQGKTESGLKYYYQFLDFAFEAMNAGSLADLFSKLIRLQKLHANQEQLNENEALEYEIWRRNMHDVFMRKFFPDASVYFSLPEDQRQEKWLSIFAGYARDNRRFYDALTSRISQTIGEPTFAFAFDQNETVSNGGLVDHLLAFFNLNPFDSETRRLFQSPEDLQLGYEFRRQILGIIIYMSELIPHLNEVERNRGRYFLDILRKAAASSRKGRSSEEQEYHLFLDPSGEAKLVSHDAAPTEKQGSLIDDVKVTEMEIDDIPFRGGKYHLRFRLFRKMRTKKTEDIFRKSIERDSPPGEIWDIIGIAVGIDNSSLSIIAPSDNKFKPLSSLFTDISKEEIQQICKTVIRRLFAPATSDGIVNKDCLLAQTAEVCGYKYSQNETKDQLDGKEPMGGTLASRPLPYFKTYTVTEREADSSPPQIQEIQAFATLEDYILKKDDDEKYAQRRYLNPKYAQKTAVDHQTGREITIYEADTMLAPLPYVLYPPRYPAFLPAYLKLMCEDQETIDSIIAQMAKEPTIPAVGT